MIKELPEFKKLKQRNLDKEAFDEAAAAILKVAEEDVYSRAMIMCMITAIEQDCREILATVCAHFAMQELKEKLEAAKQENTIN